MGSVSLEVPSGFWQTTDILKTNMSWTKLKFSAESDLKAIRAKAPSLAKKVEDILSGFENGFADALGSQVGTPIAFFIGSMLKACIDNGDTCPTSPPEAEVFI
eukprot:TRINITY_DN70478_c0_g2_i1.p1 TRINITY_DN70478_c0_g2~~TRINITY_DN70478_c0_g2_i1.p1  ORF type:complete len:121 (-),score=30.03 TRINITY_DN70478_c0_g2_i1:243-551(-)